MPGLLHDVDEVGATVRGAGREAAAQRVPRIALRIEADPQDRALDERGDGLTAEPPADVAAIQRDKDRAGGDGARRDPALERRHRACRFVAAAGDPDLPA